MSTFYGYDTSQWQGKITQDDLNAGGESGKVFWYFKGSGGDNGLYIDGEFSNSLQLGRNNSSTLKRGVYHFSGMTDARTEANFAVDNVWSKLQPGEVPILDVDRAVPTDPEWAKEFFTVADARMGFPVSIYMNQNTENSYDWKAAGLTNRPLIIADYAVSPDGNVGLRNWAFYTVQQYSSTGSIGNLHPLDLDAAFLEDINDWDKLGVQAAVVTPPLELSPLPTPTTTASDSPTTVSTTANTPTNSTPVVGPVTTPVKSTVAVVKTKSTYAVGLAMLVTSVEKYVTGHTTLSQYLTTVQGTTGWLGLAVMALRSELANFGINL